MAAPGSSHGKRKLGSGNAGELRHGSAHSLPVRIVEFSGHPDVTLSSGRERDGMNKMTLTPTLVLLSLFAFATEARADDADKAACADLEDGDDCVRGDGDPGTCVPDDSDPNVLTCEDGAFGGTDDSGGNGSGGGNEAACVDLASGDACLRDDGDEGTCVPDDSDPDVLECEDDVDGGGSGRGDNKAACVGLDEGDACERKDGDQGTCVPDDSDPNVLECEDGPFGGSDDSGDSGSGGGNEAACVDLELGDACLRDDGEEGTCVPDDSDPDVLECEDDVGGSDAGQNSGSGGDNKAVCVDLDEGDACERKDGDQGTCVPDDSDPGVLECEDEAGSSSNSDSDSGSDTVVNLSCSVGEGQAPLGTMAVLMLFGLGAVRRRMLA